jgi:hypothetical protein
MANAATDTVVVRYPSGMCMSQVSSSNTIDGKSVTE